MCVCVWGGGGYKLTTGPSHKLLSGPSFLLISRICMVLLLTFVNLQIVCPEIALCEKENVMFCFCLSLC